MKTISIVNKIAGEYKPGDLIAIGSKAGHGKSRYLIFESVSAAFKGSNVLFCPTEMDEMYVLQSMRDCEKSINPPKSNSVFGVGIYEKGKESKLNIIVKRFFPCEAKNFIPKLRSFIKSLDSKNKKPNAVFIDNLPSCPSNNVGVDSYANFMKQEYQKLKKIAEDLQIVIFISFQMYAGFDEHSPCFFGCDEDAFDYIFFLENKGVMEFSNSNYFQINVIKAKGKKKEIAIKAEFDFKEMDLKFKDLKFNFDEMTYDFSNQFKDLSLVISPLDEQRHLFLLSMADMYSKTSKNVLFISASPEPERASRLFNEEGKLLPNDMLCFENNFGKKYFCNDLGNMENFMQYITNKVKCIDDLDYIIIDDSYGILQQGGYHLEAKIYNFLLDFSMSNKIDIIVGSNTSNNSNTKGVISTNDSSGTIVKIYAASFAIGLKKHKLNLFEKLTKVEHNATINILKWREREGDISKKNKYLVKIDEDKLNFKIIKNIS